jgi:hypothetical protein
MVQNKARFEVLGYEIVVGEDLLVIEVNFSSSMDHSTRVTTHLVEQALADLELVKNRHEGLAMVHG